MFNINKFKVLVLTAVFWQITIPVIKALNENEPDRVDEEALDREKLLIAALLIGAGVVVAATGLGVVCGIFCRGKGAVPDTEDPKLQCPSFTKVYTAAEGKTTATVTWNGPSVTDNVGIEQDSITQESPALPSGPEFKEGQHIVRYTARDTSRRLGYCETKFTVSVIKCDYPSNPPNGRVTCPNYPIVIFGDTCTYSCNTGYVSDGLGNQKCLQSGTLQGPGYRCTVVICGAPTVPSNAELDFCTNDYNYDSVCSFKCKTGFFDPTNKDTQVKCQLNKQWTTTQLLCRDSSGPEIRNCPQSFTAYVDQNQKDALVHYIPPTAYDVTDGIITVTMATGGIAPNTRVAIDRQNSANNVHTIEYTAVDSDGQKNEKPCLFHVTIEELVCPMMTVKAKLLVNCTSPLSYGAKCSFSCLSGYPMIGPSEVHCDKKNNDPPTAYWNWGAWQNETYCGVVKCETLRTPQNGAMACLQISTGKHCTMSCHKDYDIPITKKGISGEYVCDDASGWVPAVPDIPDCSSRRRSTSTRLPTELFYYSGDCTNATTQQEIKENVIQNLNTISNWKFRCTNFTGCTVGNVEVTCGPVSSSGRRKKTTRTHRAIVKFYIELLIDSQGRDIDQYFTSIEDVVYKIYDDIKIAVNNGDLDMPGYETDKASYTAGTTELVCKDGLQSRFSTLSCVGCPTGQFYSSIDKTCVYCPIGTYQDMDSQKVCKFCPNGNTTKENGSKSLSDCKDMCPLGYYSSNGIYPCLPCERHTYQNQLGQKHCISCPSGTNTSTQASTSVLNCISDDDVCEGITCNGKGTCWPYGKTFKCACVRGYSGNNCTIPPDPCIHNLCQNGATCVANGTTYSCTCHGNYSGYYCHLKKVHGNWNNWGQYTSCSVSCGIGTMSRQRICDNPAPQYGGQNCPGSNVQTEVCDTKSECPSCRSFPRPIGVILETTGQKEITVKLSCLQGKTLQPALTNDTFTCSEKTGYKWNPTPADHPRDRPKCVEIIDASSLELTNQVSYQVDDVDKTQVSQNSKQTLENIAQTSNCVQSAQCKTRTTVTEVPLKRKKRAPVVTITVTHTTIVNFVSENFFVNGVFQVSTANQSLTTYLTTMADLENLANAIKNATDNGTFTLIINGKTYSPSIVQSAVVGCSSGAVAYSGICTNCPPGTYQLGTICTQCPIGSYQDREGQTTCTACASGYTTSTTGSVDQSACLTMTTTTGTSTMGPNGAGNVPPSQGQGGSNANTGGEYKAIIIIAVVVPSAIMALVAIIGIYCYCKHSSPSGRPLSRISIRPFDENLIQKEMNDYEQEMHHQPLPPMDHAIKTNAFMKPCKVPPIDNTAGH